MSSYQLARNWADVEMAIERENEVPERLEKIPAQHPHLPVLGSRGSIRYPPRRVRDHQPRRVQQRHARHNATVSQRGERLWDGEGHGHEQRGPYPGDAVLEDGREAEKPAQGREEIAHEIEVGHLHAEPVDGQHGVERGSEPLWIVFERGPRRGVQGARGPWEGWRS